jgi:hypothetical protein
MEIDIEVPKSAESILYKLSDYWLLKKHSALEKS